MAAQPATLSDGCMAWGVPSPRRGERSTGKKGGAGVNTKFSYVNASNSGSDARQAARLTADVVTPRKRATGTPAYARFRTAEPPVDSGVGARGSQRACAGRPGDRPPARLRTPRSLARAPSGGCGRRPGLPQGAESGPSAHAPAEPTFLELGAAALGHPFRHKDTVYGSRARYRRPELAEDRPHGLPRAADGPHEGTMPGPRIPVQGTETWNDAGADRVEVTVPQRTVRSIPRTMMWWRVFDASRRGWRDMATERVAVVVIECNIYSSRYEPTGPFSKHLKMSQAVAVGIVRVVGRQRAVRGDFGDATSLILKAVPEGRSTRL